MFKKRQKTKCRLLKVSIIIWGLLLTVTSGQSQIKGAVTSANDGQPLGGISVTIKSTGKASLTSASGNYSIAASAGDTLIFAGVGFQSKSIAVASESVIDVELTVLSNQLQEVVVVGYGQQKKATLTGSVATVKAEVLTDIPTSNLSNVLAGRMPGVNVTQTSGKPGMTSNISIRASGSWNNTSPLFVIDGVLSEKFAFDAIDPSEIETITVLKDAASAAVYGARAANGVILVTTKSGKSGRSTISYNATYGIADAIKIPETMNAYQQVTFINDNLRARNIDPADARYFTADEVAFYKDPANSYDWVEEAWKKPTVNRHAISASGGNSNIKYFIGGNYYYETGSFDNLNFRKWNLRGNIEAKIARNLTASLNLSTNTRNDLKPYWLWDFESDDMSNLYQGLLLKTSLVPPYINGYATGNYVEWNPFELINGNGGYNKRKWSIYNAILSLDYKVEAVPGLSFKVMYNNYSRHSFTKQLSVPYALYNFATTGEHSHIVSGTEPVSSRIRNDGEFIFEQYEDLRNYQLDAYVTYSRKFAKHGVNALFVYEQSENNGDWFNGSRQFLLSRSIDQLFATSSNPENMYVDGTGSESGRMSYVGRLNYDYDEKYIVEASFRYDGSSNFAPSKRWGFFPSLSAGWIISNENFFNKDGIMNSLKLRASAGLLGDDAVGGWQWMQRYSIYNGIVLNGVTNGISPANMPNPDITWEKSLTYNFGLDSRILDNKLGIVADVFYRHTYDILGPRILSIPSTFGATMPDENYGVINSKGVELALDYTGHISKDLSFFVSGNLAWAVNKVKEKDQAANIRPYRSEIGYNTDRIWGLTAADILRTQKDIDDLPTGYTIYGAVPQMGMMNYVDIRGANSDEPDGKIDDNDMGFISKHSTAPVNYGFRFGLSWKGLSLSVLLQGRAGSDLMINYRHIDVREVATDFSFWNNHWTPENPNAAMPRAFDNRASYVSTFWLRDASFLRVKSLDVGYELPSAFKNKIGITGAKIFINAVNPLLLIDNVKVMDPESTSLVAYPIMKSFSVGINLSL